MFRKTPSAGCADFLKKRIWIWNICSIWILWGAVICAAQTPPSGEPVAQEPLFSPLDNQQLDNHQLEEQQPEAEQKEVEIKPSEQAPDLIAESVEIIPQANLSFVDDVFRNRQNRFGFSASAYEGYITDISNASATNQSSLITGVTPRAFYNMGQRKSTLHLDVGSAYMFYHTNSFGVWDYYGSAQYTYQVSKRSSFNVTDQFIASSNNNMWSLFSINSPTLYTYNFSNEVIYNQRTTSNFLSASYNYSYPLCRKCSVGVFAGFESYRYMQNDLWGANAFDVGASFSFTLNKYLSITSSYSGYLNNVDDRLRQQQIHRLNIAGLNFIWGRHWRAWIGGGGTAIGYERGGTIGNGNGSFQHTIPDINGGIGYFSVNPSFSITHQRGYSVAQGLSEVLRTSTTRALFSYRITRRLNAGLQSYYYQNSELNGEGSLNTLAAGGMLEFALRADLSFSVNSFYQDQKSHNFSVSGLNLSRFSAYAQLTYVWPSRR